jgi:mycothiol synthase
MEFTTRPYTDADADAVAELINDITRGIPAGGILPVSEIRAGMSDVRDFATDSRVVCAPDGSLAAVAATSPPPEGGFRASLWGGVAHRWRGQGIGRDLFSWQIDRAADIHREVAPDVEWIGTSVAYVADAASIRLYERFGLKVRRYFLRMEAQLGADGPGDTKPLDGFRVTDGNGVDPQALYAADMDAFADHFGFQSEELASWLRHNIDAEDYWPEMSRIAYDGDDIAAYVLAMREDDVNGVYVARVGTRRPWRKRGLASALIADLLRAATAGGVATAALNVDADSLTGAVGVYTRNGFVATDREVSYAKVFPAV